MFRRVLVANRGEIALRVMRACRELGIGTVAVYSDEDRSAPHASAADEAVPIGRASGYLDAAALVEAALAAHADAVHPGYGFLAENAAFAAACAAAGLTFIGPPPGAIADMGSKIAARAHASAAGVPVVPGETPTQDARAIAEAAARLGYPVLVKASAGGGGKGMRIVREPGELARAVEMARQEAGAAFGDSTLYLERLLRRPRHIEVQVFGDQRGQIVHLFERDCSIQRRHQKIVEESPSPVLPDALRERMGGAAVRLARQIGYHNAGTVEFLLETGEGDAEPGFYFLEMNTRLQVEHPLTEAVLGVDLVHAQLAVAAGEPLPWRQDDLRQRGHAIECRIYAEDPSAGFLPQAGRLAVYREPSAPGIRIDSGVAEGSEVGVDFDPLLAKLVAHGETREAARRRAVAALRRYVVLGIRTNIPFLTRLLEHPHFRNATIDTGFLDEHDELARDPGTASSLAAAEAAAAIHEAPAASRGGFDPWDRLSRWGRDTPSGQAPSPGSVRVTRLSADTYRVAGEDGSRHVVVAAAGDRRQVFVDGEVYDLEVGAAARPRRAAHHHADALVAPMPARVREVLVTAGQQVASGDVLVRLEAMKMQLAVRAPRNGRVVSIACRPGELVPQGVPLLELT